MVKFSEMSSPANIRDILLPALDGRTICNGRFKLLICTYESRSNHVDEQYYLFRAKDTFTGDHVECKCVYIHPQASSTPWYEAMVNKECSSCITGIVQLLGMEYDTTLPIFYIITEEYFDRPTLYATIMFKDFELSTNWIQIKMMFLSIISTLEACQKKGVYFSSLDPDDLTLKDRSVIFTSFASAKCVKAIDADLIAPVGTWPNVDSRPQQVTTAFVAPGMFGWVWFLFPSVGSLAIM